MNSNHKKSREIEHLVIFLNFNQTNASNEPTGLLTEEDITEYSRVIAENDFTNSKY
jgi:hypothetical protein